MVEGGSKCGWRQSAGFDQEAPSSRFVLDKYASATVLLPERMAGETEDDHDTRTSVVSKRQMASVL